MGGGSGSHSSDIPTDLLVNPSLGSIETQDDICRFLLEEASPSPILLKGASVANDDKSMFGPCDAYVDPVVLLNKGTWLSPHHGHEHEIELAPLRAIDRQNLIVNFIFDEALCDCILLRIVRSDHIN